MTTIRTTNASLATHTTTSSHTWRWRSTVACPLLLLLLLLLRLLSILLLLVGPLLLLLLQHARLLLPAGCCCCGCCITMPCGGPLTTPDHQPSCMGPAFAAAASRLACTWLITISPSLLACCRVRL
jgi:hypothetical protein